MPLFSIPQSRNQAANLGGSVHRPGLKLAEPGAEIRAAGQDAGERDEPGCSVDVGACRRVSMGKDQSVLVPHVQVVLV